MWRRSSTGREVMVVELKGTGLGVGVEEAIERIGDKLLRDC